MTLELNNVYHMDAITLLGAMPDASVDAIVTDPPAGIAFMNKDWDKDKGGRKEWITWMEGIASEALRVLKPGGHALVWAIPRTSHWTGMAWEDAGFEVRDKVYHTFGSGLPKGTDISKQIDKKAGAVRGVVDKDAPSTPEAQAWHGWNSALKPAVEEWWMFRKPLIGTLAVNTLAWGVGRGRAACRCVPGGDGG